MTPGISTISSPRNTPDFRPSKKPYYLSIYLSIYEKIICSKYALRCVFRNLKKHRFLTPKNHPSKPPKTDRFNPRLKPTCQTPLKINFSPLIWALKRLYCLSCRKIPTRALSPFKSDFWRIIKKQRYNRLCGEPSLLPYGLKGIGCDKGSGISPKATCDRKWRTILATAVYSCLIITISFLIFNIPSAYAGTLEPASAPAPTMKTLTDIRNRISSGTAAGAHSLAPASAPGPTGFTLQEIYDALPAGSSVPIAVSSEVVTGKTFILRSGGVLVFSTGTLINTAGMPDTDQASSYTTTFGEDHDYQPAATQMSYTDNGDGTITDNRTGLMWLKDANQYNGGAAQTWEAALSGCEGFTYAGYTDWRLPNVKELITIVRYEGSAPYINTTYFLNTQSNYYWTSTTYVPTTTYAMFVNFGSGSVNVSTKTNTYYVRPVRGGP